jgi:hypothetical protein
MTFSAVELCNPGMAGVRWSARDRGGVFGVRAGDVRREDWGAGLALAPRAIRVARTMTAREAIPVRRALAAPGRVGGKDEAMSKATYPLELPASVKAAAARLGMACR